MVSTEIKKAIVDEMAEELDSRDYEFERTHLNTIVTTCIKNKNNLIELFSKHPHWNPEKLMIQFDTDIERKICTEEVGNFTYWLRDKVDGHYDWWAKRLNEQKREYHICNFIGKIDKQFFDESMAEDIENVNKLNDKYKLRTNMKASKAIGKICREEGWDKLDGYNQKYAALCDCLNPLKVKRHTCISLNPIDYLLMSNGNSWSSCHDIDNLHDDPGCYSSGTISYMLDHHSFVFYTVSADYDGNQIEREPKIQRQMFGYNDEVIAQLRLYPQDNDSGAEKVYDDIRAIVQKVISDCLGKPNMWVKSTKDIEEVIRKGSGATCYPDWVRYNPGASHCSLSTHKERANGKENREIVFGAEPICIECGRRHSYDENISCCVGDYYEDSYEYCTDCGCRIDSEDVYWVDDNPYCDGCVSYCDDCEEYVPNDEINEIDGDYVCDHCLEHGDYFACDDCGELHHISYLTKTEDGYKYCENCYDDNTFICDECGETYSNNSEYYDEITDCYYCKNCYKKLLENRKEELEYKLANLATA